MRAGIQTHDLLNMSRHPNLSLLQTFNYLLQKCSGALCQFFVATV